jgi:two-component system chemotaxis sensor kinase CheA
MNQKLDRLLSQEIDRRLGVPGDPPPTLEALRAVLHALKGSASMAGHHDLTLLVTQLGQRVRAGEEGVVECSIDLIRRVSTRLKDGKRPFESVWPEPPEGLIPSTIAPDQRGEYRTILQDRLHDLELVIARGFGDVEQLDHAGRIIHSMKSLAASVGDDFTAWYCHHLEARLRKPEEKPGGPLRIFGELAGHRVALLRLLESPEEAFALLRAHRVSYQKRRTTPPPFRYSDSGLPRSNNPSYGTRNSTLPPLDDLDAEADATLRIPTATVDQLFDRIEHAYITSNEWLQTGRKLRHLARKFSDLRHDLVDVIRMSQGGNKTVNALQINDRLVHALTVATDGIGKLDRIEQDCRLSSAQLRTEWDEARKRLVHLRRTTLTKVFARCVRAVHRFAESEGKVVSVEVIGGEWSIDRTLAERLSEPLLQIAKNAISHGIELPEQRVLQGKPREGRLRLIAERHGEWLRLIIEDDGAGVDLERVRQRAISQGLLSEAEAQDLHENELLGLLFVPGLSVRAQANIMAGRGIGLDLSQDVVRRLGGGIRFSAREQGGVRVTLELPRELGIVDVVWVKSGTYRFAIPVTFTGQIASNLKHVSAPTLLKCLGLPEVGQPSLVIELVIPGLRPLALGIDDLGEFEEVTVRPLPTLLAKSGPYSGAVLVADGRLDLVLDAPLVAARAWFHGV